MAKRRPHFVDHFYTKRLDQRYLFLFSDPSGEPDGQLEPDEIYFSEPQRPTSLAKVRIANEKMFQNKLAIVFDLVSSDVLNLNPDGIGVNLGPRA